MLRLFLLAIVIVAIAALFLRAPRLRLALLCLLALMVLYAVLKLTGVIEAMAPDRIGVF